MGNVRKWITVLAAVLVASAASVHGQGTHYWSLQYGTRSTLLGGAIIGDVDDLSATYYNPGAMTLLDSGQVILAARVFQHTKYIFTSGLQAETELDDRDLDPVPTFVAGSLPYLLIGKTRLAYSLLVRHKFNMVLEGRRIDARDIVSQSLGSESFNSLAEAMYGITE